MSSPSFPYFKFQSDILLDYPEYFIPPSVARIYEIHPDLQRPSNPRHIAILCSVGTRLPKNALSRDLANSLISGEIPEDDMPSWLARPLMPEQRSLRLEDESYVALSDDRKRQLVLAALLNVPVALIQNLPSNFLSASPELIPDFWIRSIRYLDSNNPTVQFATNLMTIDYLISYNPAYISTQWIGYRLEAEAYETLLNCKNSRLLDWIYWMVTRADREWDLFEIEVLLGVKNYFLVPPARYPALPVAIAKFPIEHILKLLNTSDFETFMRLFNHYNR